MNGLARRTAAVRHQLATKPDSNSEESNLKFAPHSQGLNSISRPASDRLDRQRWIHAANGWKNGTVTNPQIWDIPRSAIDIDHTGFWIIAHPGRAVKVTRVVSFVPYFRGADSFEGATHKAERMVNESLVVLAV
jgi:hypothetical protein